jgi:two-component system, chemotaxis family, protein-glutamate methylesterase/glutaminase
MRKIRVLVVDDAVTVRRLVSQVLAEDAAIDVVGAAATGRIALAKIPQTSPDLVTLDIEMPDMDGLTALGEIRRQYAGLPVIMLSSFTEKGAVATLEALARGATDYVPKPSRSLSAEAALEYLRHELVPRVKAIGSRAVQEQVPIAVASAAAKRRPGSLAPVLRPMERLDVVAIGVSTGGPNALSQLLPELPRSFPVPIVIVQHMPPVFTALLAERLRTVTALDVREGVNGGEMNPGKVWLAPGDTHMIVQQGENGVSLRLHKGPPENSCRPAVDVLFRSVAEVYGANAMAVVMTGMGQDGFIGCQVIRRSGGQVLAQDEATSVVWGMPGYVVHGGLAEAVLPLDQLAPEIVRRVAEGRPPNGLTTARLAGVSHSGGDAAS